MLVERIAVVLLAVLLLVTTLGIADRYLIGLGLTWTEELARFTLIWLSLIAAVAAMQRGAHFQVDLLVRRLGRIYFGILSGVCAVLALVVAWFGLELALKFDHQISPALGIPMSWVYAAVPVSFTGMALCLAVEIVRPRKPHGVESMAPPREGSE